MSKKDYGKLIVLDGTDGSGKATQTKILVKRLKEKGFKVRTLDFPQYYKTFFGRMAGRYLKGEFGGVSEVGPYLASVLYAADRWQAKEEMGEWLKQGRIIISNRYVSANQIHQAAKIRNKKEKEKFLRWLDELEFKVFKIPRPDIVLYLYVPYKIGQKLVDKKGYREYIGKKKKDIHEVSREHLKRAEKQGLELTQKYKNWTKVNCVHNNKILPRKVIAEKVWEIVRKILK